jgi:heme/copper-type cytochrome/quinol oxidase subunit 3
MFQTSSFIFFVSHCLTFPCSLSLSFFHRRSPSRSRSRDRDVPVRRRVQQSFDLSIHLSHTLYLSLSSGLS